jgi:hypothetical protein
MELKARVSTCWALRIFVMKNMESAKECPVSRFQQKLIYQIKAK